MKAHTILLLISVLGLSSSSVYGADISRLRIFAPVSENAEAPAEDEPINLSLAGLSFDLVIEQEVTEGPTTDGFSVHYVGESGFGIGFTTVATTFTRTNTVNLSQYPILVAVVGGKESVLFATEEAMITPQFLDFSYTFGTELSLTVGYGRIIGGASTDTFTYNEEVFDLLVQLGLLASYEKTETVETIRETAIGTNTNFVLLGFMVDSFEILLGVRNVNLIGDFDLKGSTIGALLKEETRHNEVTFTQYQFGIGLTF